METFSDPLFEKVHALAVELLEGTLSPGGRHELETLILSNPAARKAYLEYVQESACLRWLCVEEGSQIVELATAREKLQAERSRRWRIASIVLSGGLACLLAVMGVNWLQGRAGSADVPGRNAIAVAAPTPAPKHIDETKLPVIERKQGD